MSQVLLATRNAGKLVELRRILDATGLAVAGLEVVGLADVPGFPDAPETGATFAENALAKARDAAAATGLPSVADDSGLAVDALNGMPGVLSARWAGVSDTPRQEKDDANNALLLAQLGDVPDSRRGAAFVCAVAFAVPGEEHAHVAMGRMPGHVIRENRGSGGFGYDVLFCAEGHDVTTAELSVADKDAISHRGKALREIAPLVARVLSS